MPAEHKASRSYHEALRRIGVVNPEEVRVGTPIQFVALVDDMTNLVPKVVVPVVAFSGGSIAPGVGNHAGFHLSVRSAGGAYILGVGGTATWHMGVTDTVIATVATAARVLDRLTWPFGEPTSSILTSESWGIGDIFTGTNRRSQPLGSERLESDNLFYLRPGQHVYIWADISNTVFNGFITWREVPRDDFSQA